MKKDKNRLKESLTVSVLRVCQFTSLVVFLWRLLISAECRLQFYCQRWWKEEREREREGKLYSCQQRGICDRSRVVPNAGAKHGDSLSSCLLTHVFAAGPLAAESDTPVQWATVDKRSRCSEKLQCLGRKGQYLIWFQVCISTMGIPLSTNNGDAHPLSRSSIVS